MSDPKAQAAKEKGNQAFKTGDYPTAIGHYTSAILADKNDATFYLNRAAAYLKLGKFEDAERDCTTVLGLSKNNVKALFRRGQARVALGNLLEAQQDFSEVLRIEPSNTAAQDELKTVTSLIQKEKAKKAKVPISSVQSSLAPETTTGKRRRVPINIIDASGRPVSASVPSALSAPAPAPSLTSLKTGPPSPEPMEVDTEPLAAQPPLQPQPPKSKASAPDTLEAVSSRSLKSPSPVSAPSPAPAAPSVAPPASKAPPAPAAAAAPPKSSPSPSPAQTPQQQQQPPKPAASSFKEAKEARQSIKQSRVGGGIFRKNGDRTIFPPRGGDNTSSASTGAAPGGDVAMDVDDSSTAPAPATAPSTSPFIFPTQPLGSLNGGKPPTTLFEFSRLWENLKTPEERWQLINMIPPTQFPTLCKTSLEPSLLISILETFLVVLQSLSSSSSTSTKTETEQVKQRIKEYMDNFTRIPRFSTLLLFLSKKEKAVARDVWDLLGVDGRALLGQEEGGVWKAVGV